MITGLKVSGFKNLINVNVQFGEFTCIAGPNGSGKSNLFDAILFLSHLAERPLLEAAHLVRDPEKKSFDIASLFYRTGNKRVSRMSFEVEMLIPKTGTDDLGQHAVASTTFVTYRLELELNEKAGVIGGQPLTIIEESLSHITLGKARKHFLFKGYVDRLEALGVERRSSPFITTDQIAKRVKIHQDTRSEGRSGSGGRPRLLSLKALPRTVLSTVSAAEAPTALLAKREMQSWRLLQLEPSAMRSPDSFTSQQTVLENGSHLPATLGRLFGMTKNIYGSRYNEINQLVLEKKALSLKQNIVSSIGSLIDGITDVTVDIDPKRETFTLMVSDYNETRHEARSLSDGTLRFLALAIIANDPEAAGLICMEEPENGIHPRRIHAILKLLRGMANNPTIGKAANGPLKQVIINTHSPLVVGMLDANDVLFAKPLNSIVMGKEVEKTAFIPIQGTWRTRLMMDSLSVEKGDVINYLNALNEAFVGKGILNTARYVGLESALPFVELKEDE